MPPVSHRTEPSAALLGRQLLHELLNLALIYTNSLLFSALFSFDSIPVFLVRAVFNGSGIIMVLGLLSLIIGNIAAGIRHTDGQFAWFGGYYSNLLLMVLQVMFLVVIAVVLGMKYIG